MRSRLLCWLAVVVVFPATTLAQDVKRPRASRSPSRHRGRHVSLRTPTSESARGRGRITSSSSAPTGFTAVTRATRVSR